jgi:hypothetical protein
MTLQAANTFGLFRQTFPHVAYFAYVQELRKQLSNCQSCLEVGCGPDSPGRLVPFERYAGFDGYAPNIKKAKAAYPNHQYQVGRAEDLGAMYEDKSFDCVIALDLIEHLKKEDGLRMIDQMERIATKRILLFTPNGFLSQQSHNGDLQEHLSGWTAEEMRALGFNVIGMHGPKKLRGEKHQIKLKPIALGGIVCQLGQLYTRGHPESAAALLCVRDA